jgi:hypothetical protein
MEGSNSKQPEASAQWKIAKKLHKESRNGYIIAEAGFLVHS